MSLQLVLISLCTLNLFGVGFVGGEDCESCSEAGIMCLYPSSDPGPNCIDYKNDEFTVEEKKAATKRMNELRNKVALGEEKRGDPGPQPSAANMREMVWDDYLAKTAQKYADQCTFEHSPGECRTIDKYVFGENLAYSFNDKSDDAYMRFINSWYEEVVDFPNNLVDNYGTTDISKIGHYAQMVYSEVYHVGCGRTRWGNDLIMVCHYGPSVMALKPLYKRGPPASDCEKGASSTYEGLCATDKPDNAVSEPSGSIKIYSTYIVLDISIILSVFIVH